MSNLKHPVSLWPLFAKVCCKACRAFTCFRWTSLGVGFVWALLAPGVGLTQTSDWPNHPIKFVVGYPAGGSADVVGRLFGDYLSRSLGQPIIVENRSGAGGTIGALSVVRGEPD